MAIIVVGELLDSEFGEAEFLGFGDAFVLAHVDEMHRGFATPGMVFGEYIAECAFGTAFGDTGFWSFGRCHNFLRFA